MAKGYEHLIKIMQQLTKEAAARLVILGDGSLKETYIQLAASLGLKICDWGATKRFEEADIYLMGYQPNVFKFYKHSSAYALSSLYEGFPNVMAEALICGTPVVAADCHTGPREIFNLEGIDVQPLNTALRLTTGSLVPRVEPFDDNVKTEWVKELKYWLQSSKPDKKVIDGLTERFTLDAMLQQWEEVIEH
jgi:glycosyltransferase involved in cell wall biosynthesis